jgi:protein-S-isoprenylcysteine O-methyltransferase Ste14
MALQVLEIQWIILVANLVFGLLIGVRMAASWGRHPSAGATAEPSASIGKASSTQTWIVFWPTVVVMVGYPVAYLLWAVDPRLVGPALLPSILALQLAGIVVMAGGLALIAWAYVVFRSFRLLAQVDPGHELCQDGPFAWLRHPIYCGFNLFYLGSFLLVPHVGCLIQVVASVLALDVRARFEERVLLRAFGDRYASFMARTRRFVPGLY